MFTKQKSRPECVNDWCSNPSGRNGISKKGFQKWSKYCTSCRRNAYSSEYHYRLAKKDFCSECGFIPKHRVQLDVDHIDGNKLNTAPSNLQTLCANCHRLKTHMCQDHLNDYNQPDSA